ncbi:MAG: 5'-nucleotidase C-terminal domain-containing protein [Dysgonamonadaceae bacterium]|nr:5'-nucleotidase C-terminal domain-containing protein [Dysgonamonadaceae bacterium]
MKIRFLYCLFLLFTIASCNESKYVISHIDASYVAMDSTFDGKANPDIVSLINLYKKQLDAEMNVVIGKATRNLTIDPPDYLLVNLTADAMKQYGDEHIKDGVDMAFMNINGHRASLNKGTITLGDIYRIYPFDNELVFLELKGDDLEKIFNSFAEKSPQGFSSNIKLTIQNQQVNSLTIDGKPLDKDKIYKIITLDYLAEGNDGMSSLKNAITTSTTGILLRNMMIDYIKRSTIEGREIDMVADQRLTIK